MVVLVNRTIVAKLSIGMEFFLSIGAKTQNSISEAAPRLLGIGMDRYTRLCMTINTIGLKIPLQKEF